MSRSRFSTFLELSINTPSTRVTSGKRSVSGSFAQMLDEDVRRLESLADDGDHRFGTRGARHVRGPGDCPGPRREVPPRPRVQTPAGDPLAKTKDAA